MKNFSLKGWIILSIVLFAILIFDSCYNNDHDADVVACDVNLDDLLKDTVSFDSVFCDVTFIPLENNRDGMLSFVSKMIVTKDYYIVLDFNTYPQVVLFSHDGDYKGTVGRLGHGRGEYEFIFDVSADMDGNIVLSTFDSFMVFDSGGNFVRSIKTNRDSFMKNVLCYQDGIVCATNYSSGASSLLQFFDQDYKWHHEMISPDDVVLGNPPRMRNTLHVTGDTLCYFNPYTSEITLLDLSNYQTIKRYSIVSKNMLNMEKSQQENSGIDIGDVDAVYSYYLRDGKVISYLSLNESGTILEVDTETDGYRLSVPDGWFPEICDVHDQYYYSILSQEEFLELAKGELYTTGGTRMMISKACEKMNRILTEKDNYVIMKAKRR